MKQLKIFIIVIFTLKMERTRNRENKTYTVCQQTMDDFSLLVPRST